MHLMNMIILRERICFNNKSGGTLNFEILASEEQPLQNLVIVVNNWE